MSSTIAMLYVWQVHRRDPAVRYWALGFLCWGLGTLVFALPKLPPVAAGLGNIVGVAASTLLYLGTARFFERPAARRLLWVVYTPSVAWQLYWSVVVYSLPQRVLDYCLCICLAAALVMRELWLAGSQGKRTVYRFLAVCWASILLATALRGWFTLTAPAMVSGSGVDAPSLIWFVVIQSNLVLLSVGYLLMASQRLQQRLDDLANHDELTGVLNRRAFYGAIAERRRSPQSGPIALLALDLDHFKQINDRYGHAGGDAALRQLTGAIRQRLRNHDLFARAGGEEFWLMLPDTGAAEAAQAAERLRAAVETQLVSHEGQSFRVTVSIGLALVDAARLPAELDKALAAADRALYAAKSAGRNRVMAEAA